LKPNNFSKNKKMFFILPIALLIISIATTFIFSVRQDTKFGGGALVSYSHNGTLDTTKVQEIAASFIEGETLTVRIQTNSFVKGMESPVYNVFIEFPNCNMTDGQEELLTTKIKEAFPDAGVEKLDFLVPAKETRLKTLAKYAFVAALIAIILLIFTAVRYKVIGGIKTGLAIIAALLTDAIIAYTVFVFSRIEITGAFIAIVLFALAFTLYQSLIIFDKIKDYRQKETGLSNEELTDSCIKRMYYRITFTTILGISTMGIISVFAIIFGAFSILKFSLPLAIVILGGAYSSVYLAAPIWAKFAKPIEILPETSDEDDAEEDSE